MYSVRVLGGELRPGGDVEEVDLYTYEEALDVLKGKAGYYAVKKWLDKRINST